MKSLFSISTVKSSGFSLVELLLVIGLLSIVLVILVPSFRGASHDRELVNGAKTVQSALMRTFTQTRSSGQSFGVVLKDEGSGGELYQCTSSSSGGCDLATKQILDEGGLFEDRYQLDIDTDLEVFFDPPHGDVVWGGASPSTRTWILTHKKSGKQRQVTLHELSGLIEITTP